jgi:hypothetical protein
VPEARDRAIDQVAHIVLAAHVCTDELGLCAEGAQFRGQSLPGFLVAAGNDNAAAFRSENERRRPANACQRTSDQHNRVIHRVAPRYA